jgi:putative transposase
LWQLQTETEASGYECEPTKKGIPAEQLKAVLVAKGELSAVEQLRQRVRYFSDGLVVGGKAAVKGVFE